MKIQLSLEYTLLIVGMLTIFKLSGLLHISWLWVLAPIWGTAAIIGLFFLSAFIVYAFIIGMAAWLDRS